MGNNCHWLAVEVKLFSNPSCLEVSLCLEHAWRVSLFSGPPCYQEVHGIWQVHEVPTQQQNGIFWRCSSRGKRIELKMLNTTSLIRINLFMLNNKLTSFGVLAQPMESICISTSRTELYSFGKDLHHALPSISMLLDLFCHFNTSFVTLWSGVLVSGYHNSGTSRNSRNTRYVCIS